MVLIGRVLLVVLGNRSWITNLGTRPDYGLSRLTESVPGQASMVIPVVVYSYAFWRVHRKIFDESKKRPIHYREDKVGHSLRYHSNPDVLLVAN